MEINKANTTRLLNSLVKGYFEEEDNQSIELIGKKIVEILDIEFEGVRILPQSIVVDVSEALDAYRAEKIDLEEKADEFIEEDYYSENLRGYRQQIIKEINAAIYCMKLH